MTQTIQISHQQTNKNKKLGVLAHDRNTQGNTTKQNKREDSIAEASTLMQGLQCLCRDFSAYVGASVLTWGLQCLHGGFSTYMGASVPMQRAQYLCRGFSTYARASVLTHWLQYLHISFSTYALASVLMHWLQYLHTYAYPQYLPTYAYPLMPTYLCLLTYAYTQCSYHAYAYPHRRCVVPKAQKRSCFVMCEEGDIIAKWARFCLHKGAGPS
jgi:hypothetical protein